jgi:hypothetical protein
MNENLFPSPSPTESRLILSQNEKEKIPAGIFSSSSRLSALQGMDTASWGSEDVSIRSSSIRCLRDRPIAEVAPWGPGSNTNLSLGGRYDEIVIGQSHWVSGHGYSPILSIEVVRIASIAEDDPWGPGSDTNLSLRGGDATRSSYNNLTESRVMGNPQASVVVIMITSQPRAILEVQVAMPTCSSEVRCWPNLRTMACTQIRGRFLSYNSRWCWRLLVYILAVPPHSPSLVTSRDGPKKKIKRKES